MKKVTGRFQNLSWISLCIGVVCNDDKIQRSYFLILCNLFTSTVCSYPFCPILPLTHPPQPTMTPLWGSYNDCHAYHYWWRPSFPFGGPLIDLLTKGWKCPVRWRGLTKLRLGWRTLHPGPGLDKTQQGFLHANRHDPWTPHKEHHFRSHGHSVWESTEEPIRAGSGL